VTLLVPAVVTIAVLTALLGGGFRGLGALGQVLTGPQVPEARLAATALHTRHHVAHLPAVPVLRPVAGGFAGTPAAAGPASPAAPRRGDQPAPPTAAAPPRRTSPVPSVPGGPAGGPPASPGPRPAPDPLRSTGDQVAHQIGAVPAVGPAGQSAVTTVLDVVDPPPAVARALSH
jgi:hypothetical protein